MWEGEAGGWVFAVGGALLETAAAGPEMAGARVDAPLKPPGDASAAGGRAGAGEEDLLQMGRALVEELGGTRS